jgi:hypothetical protein
MCSVFLLRTVSEAHATLSGGKGSTTKCPTLEVGKMVGYFPFSRAVTAKPGKTPAEPFFKETPFWS